MNIPTAGEMEARERKSEIYVKAYAIVKYRSDNMNKTRQDLVDEIVEMVIKEIQSE